MADGKGPTADGPAESDSGLTRRRLLQLGGGLAVAAAMPRSAIAGSTSVPTFEQVTGDELGRLRASTAEIEQYLQAVAEASPRVVATQLPTRTIEGRAIPYAIISAPENLEALETIASRTRELRQHPPSDADAEQAARELPAFVHVFANVHGNEPSGADGMIQVLYDLATRDDAANQQRLSELIVFMMPVQNPDGREAYRRTNSSGFDLNRDWFAHTQPETPTKVALYTQYPPILGMDLHEQFFSAPETFWFPPNGDPIHHETSPSGLASVNETFSPAVASAFDSKDYYYEHYGGYDVFAPIYGDSVPEQAFGAAGVLFEMENENSYPNKFERMYVGIDAAVTAAAQNKRRLLTAWIKQWGEARDEGLAGKLLPNIVQEPDADAPLEVPDELIYGYALEPKPHGADLAHLVDRLRAFEIELEETEAPTTVSLMRPFGGGGFGEALLPTGTIIVSAGQPMKRFVHMLLADDPYPAAHAYYDVAGWSNPALMNVRGGAIGEPLDGLFGDGGGCTSVRPIARAAEMRALRREPQRATAYAFATDAALAQAAAFALLGDGVTVRRSTESIAGLPAGAAVVGAAARAAGRAAAEEYGISPVALGAMPEDLSEIRRPRVALIHDRFSDAFQYWFARSSGFAQWLLETRFGLDVEPIYAYEIKAGTLARGDFDALVVPNGFSTIIPGGYPSLNISFPALKVGLVGLLEMRRFVSDGGLYLGWSQQGISLARAAGLAPGLGTVHPRYGFIIPGSPFSVELVGGDPATLGIEGTSYVFNARDPILTGGETTVARYPAEPLALGYAEGLEQLADTVAASSARLGSGRAYTMAFDPAYRGWSEAAQRLVGNALLAPVPGPGGGEPAEPDLGQLESAAGYERKVVIRAPSSGARALRGALGRVSGVPSDASLYEQDDGALELQAVDVEPFSGHTAGWIRETLQELADAGVKPTLVVA